MLKFRKLISLLCIYVLLSPTIIRLEHHHEHIEPHFFKEPSVSELHESCAVCNFEFSFFIQKSVIYKIEKFTTLYIKIAAIYDFIFTHPYSYSFLLRAPPAGAS